MYETITCNLAPTAVRRVIQNGQEWLVADGALLNPGVLPGNHGPLMYTSTDCETTANAWDGMPIVHYHPYDPLSGEPLAALDSRGVINRDVWERQGIGEVRRPYFNRKTRAELWFNAALTRRKAPDVYKALLTNIPMEISTGLYTSNQPAPPGSVCPRSSRSFNAYARHHRPDHLAILHPTQTGACSIADGCGVLVNSTEQPRDEKGRFLAIGTELAKHLLTKLHDPQEFREAYSGLDDQGKKAVVKGLKDKGLIHPVDARKRGTLTTSEVISSVRGQITQARDAHSQDIHRARIDKHTPFEESDAYKRMTQNYGDPQCPT